MIDFLQEALIQLVPTPNWYSWAKTDSDGNTIRGVERQQVKYVIVEKSLVGKIKRPTDGEIQTKVDELKAEYQKNKYQRDRASAYPPLEEQMDLLYHGGLDALKGELKKTKDKFPKP